MSVYAVIDTNVLVSAFVTKNPDSATVKIVNAVFEGKIIPLFHSSILKEYSDVLCRNKFHLNKDDVKTFIAVFKSLGKEVFPTPTGEILPDEDDLVFYEVAMEKQSEHSYLVTGNQKHYPVKDFIVTPKEMIEILNKQSSTTLQ